MRKVHLQVRVHPDLKKDLERFATKLSKQFGMEVTLSDCVIRILESAMNDVREEPPTRERKVK